MKIFKSRVHLCCQQFGLLGKGFQRLWQARRASHAILTLGFMFGPAAAESGSLSWYLAQGPWGKESQAVTSPVGAILAWHVVTGTGVGMKGYFLVCSSWQ